MAPVVIHLVAASSASGKTTVLEKVIPLLKKRGYRVAVLKGNLKHCNFDQPGKDSRRFAEAGAEIAGFATADSFMLTGKSAGQSGSEAAVSLLSVFDLVLVEGDKKSDRPKIELVRKETGQEPLLRPNTVAVLSDRDDLKLDLPLFGLNDHEALVRFIEESFLAGPAARSDSEQKLTHFDRAGRPRMVDVSAKDSTTREAFARGEILLAAETLDLIMAGRMAKGDVLSVAQVAAVMAVKETSRLIPMAHPLNISGVDVDFYPRTAPDPRIEIGVRVKLTGQTGVEMEALAGVSAAALTIYDMCKAVDKNMVIQNIRLVEKKGGRSGHYRREQE